LGEKLCRTPEQFKAWSQNLGHDRVLTTFSSYGDVARERQREIIRELGHPKEEYPHAEEFLKQLIDAAKRTAA
jgi:integrase/recombinase XerD